MSWLLTKSQSFVTSYFSPKKKQQKTKVTQNKTKSRPLAIQVGISKQDVPSMPIRMESFSET